MSAVCVASLVGGHPHDTIHAATQFPQAAHGAAVAALGVLDDDRVEIRGLQAGGSFGRRYAADFVYEVAAICRALGISTRSSQWRA